MTLNELRERIDELDRNIKELFLKRIDVSKEVAQIKFHTGDKILKPEREKEIIQNLCDDLDENLKYPYASLLRKYMELSRCIQYSKMLELGAEFQLRFTEEPLIAESVCFQGIPGSYSEMAVKNIFPGIEAHPIDTFEELFQCISRGKHQAGVVPIENTTAGSVYEVYDLLMKYDLYINHMNVVKVEHCLAAVQGACLEDIKEVYSHPQAIAQSMEFLKVHGIKGIAGSNTAIAAKEVSERQDISIGTICSSEAA
ncbi:MAG TPA: bifunctional chorismate mutase/prephenate dehydratase, partial [Clostridiales bacterium]|nr:bifunctional chorismate mutase/prephenate dehydratase [Clostridiales bacterium]